MKVLFFSVPYIGHLVPNVKFFEEILVRGHDLYIYGHNDFLEKHVQTVYGINSRIHWIEYADYIEDAYRIRCRWDGDEVEAKKEYFKSVYSEEQINNSHYHIVHMQTRFYREFSKKHDIQEFDVIAYDTYAYYCKNVIKNFKGTLVEVNSAVWEPQEYFNTKSWINYLENIVIRELHDSFDIGNICSIHRKIKRRIQKRDRVNQKIYYICYHSPLLQWEKEELNEEYTYIGYKQLIKNNKEKEDIIYVSRGTMSDYYSMSLLRPIIKAVGDKRNIHISMGNDEKSYKIMQLEYKQDNVNFHIYCNQIDMLQRSSIYITHGGVTGVREAIFCNTPMIIVPTNYQEYLVGKAIEEAGAGILVDVRPVDACIIREAINEVYENIERFIEGVRTIRNELECEWKKSGIVGFCDTIGL